ncbi:nucleotidyltransferase family protein [Neobacillus sp. SM06]|uniref:nucleotidyltransferase family protein n=1 Tax=Neobacillus sp. SM06 TaxID=3422492 RepID=UPI003D274EC2
MFGNWNDTGISLKFLQELRQFCCENTMIDKVILFGSRARGDYRKTSDIDLAIFTNHASHQQQNVIHHSINEMSTPLKIDVLFFDRLTKAKLKSNILNEGVIIYEKGAGLREA